MKHRGQANSFQKETFPLDFMACKSLRFGLPVAGSSDEARRDSNPQGPVRSTGGVQVLHVCQFRHALDVAEWGGGRVHPDKVPSPPPLLGLSAGVFPMLDRGGETYYIVRMGDRKSVV